MGAEREAADYEPTPWHRDARWALANSAGALIGAGGLVLWGVLAAMPGLAVAGGAFLSFWGLLYLLLGLYLQGAHLEEDRRRQRSDRALQAQVLEPIQSATPAVPVRAGPVAHPLVRTSLPRATVRVVDLQSGQTAVYEQDHESGPGMWRMRSAGDT